MSEGAGEIRRLDQQTIERIAAGEVVERPASAVKELVENSIDADASRITVQVAAGGTEEIRISDNGIGMGESELRRAVEVHTTSKITDIDDLETGVATLGFRGEALHAIGAVSRMTINSRPRGGDQGTELTVEGGTISDISPAGCPEGTTVTVRDLFFNVPARRKYLSEEATEFAHVNSIVTNYALANPEVAIALEHDGRETFATTGSGDLRETVLSVYGHEVAEAMIPLDAEEPDLPDGPLQAVRGLVSNPEVNRASREYLSTFVNGRYVTATTVRKAVVEAYGTQLAGDRYPFAAVFLTLDPGVVDVNVHPRKLEVRFAAEEAVTDQVRTAVENALLSEGLIRSSAPRGRSAPEQTKIQPTRRTVEDRESPETVPSGRAHEIEERMNSEQSVGNGAQDTSADGPRRTSPKPSVGGSEIEHGQDEPGDTGSSTRSDAASFDEGWSPPEQAGKVAGQSPTESRDGGSDGENSAGLGTGIESNRKTRKFHTPGEQLDLYGTAPDIDLDRLPAMRLLGQLHDTYLVAETDDGMVLVDQHAADERINYERLQQSIQGETTTQALARPVTLELTAREVELFEAHNEALTRLGFHASLVGERTVEVTTVPSFVVEAAGPELVRDVLGAFVTSEVAATDTVEAVVDRLLADLACYPSITGNTSLHEGSIVDLLTSLDACDNPYACPHGRPVVVEIDTDELEARFERDYPGHQ